MRTLLACVAVVLVLTVCGMLSGCGSGGSTSSGPSDPGGAALSVGSLRIEVASAAGFKTTQLHSPDLMPYAFTAFWGSEIVRLQDVGSEGKIAYDRDSGSLDIFVMEPDGANKTQLTTHVGSETGPSWSPARSSNSSRTRAFRGSTSSTTSSGSLSGVLRS